MVNAAKQPFEQVGNPILRAELKRQRFPGPYVSGGLLLVLWGISRWVVANLREQIFDPVYGRGLFGLYLVWLALPLVVASVTALWLGAERESERFQMVRQTGLSDRQISEGYTLGALYRLRLLLVMVNGLLPLLLLEPVPDGAGRLLFSIGSGYSTGGWLMLMLAGLVWCWLGASTGVAVSLRGNGRLIVAGSVALALLGVFHFVKLSLGVPLWLIGPGLDLSSIKGFLVVLFLLSVLFIPLALRFPWRSGWKWLEIGLGVGLLLVGLIELTRVDYPLLHQYAVERHVLGILDVQGVTPDHCSWLVVQCDQTARTRFLDLSDNQLSQLPPEIGQLSSLQTLDLGNNQLSALPPEIGNLSSLQMLDLLGNQLSALPPEIGNLSSLQMLDLGYNQLSKLPPEIGQLSSLQTLDLGNNQLSKLPPEVGNLSSLQMLDLGNNQLSKLPPEIGNLSSLQTLDLDHNQLSALPPEIGQLSSLQTLDLLGNQLSALPPEIGQLSSLQTLDLGNNQLSELPPEIGQLSGLQWLGLEGNQLGELPPEIGNLSSLQTLDLGYNQLSELPPEIGNLSGLYWLLLEGNQLSELPPEIGNLSSLYRLFLEGNQLSELPPEIGNLSSLYQLHLDYNQLNELPPEIGQLSSLQELGLSDNQLSTLPIEFCPLLSQLDTFDVDRLLRQDIEQRCSQ
jgi:Leucine-rich repeat (LRR) protein